MKDLTGEKLQGEVEKMLVHSEKLESMRTAALKVSRPNAAIDIAKQALDLVKNERGTASAGEY